MTPLSAEWCTPLPGHGMGYPPCLNLGQGHLPSHQLDGVPPQNVNRQTPVKTVPSLILCTQAVIRHVAHVIGKLILCTVACPLGILQKHQVHALQSHDWNQNVKIRLNNKAKSELLWWLHNIKDCCTPIIRDAPTRTVFSDTSNCAWGFVYKNCVANRQFSLKELPLSINTKETLAILFGFKSLKKHMTSYSFLK